MDNEKNIKECDKLINRFILRSRKFIEYGCFQYGLCAYAMSGKPDASLVSDFQYFVFTKSTKSLESIRSLLKLGHMEDVIIIVRTMFEGYLASRYIDEKYEESLLYDFIFVPQLIAQRKAIYENRIARLRDTNEIIEYIQREPSKMKLGKDKGYFYELYAYMCDFAHCNFSIIYNYIDTNGCFTCDNVVNQYLVRVIVLFVFLKTFECIVTVEGEDFIDAREERLCYKLVEEVTLFVNNQLDYLSKYDSKNVNDELNKHMKKMFKEMKKSLKEEVGNVKKDFLV